MDKKLPKDKLIPGTEARLRITKSHLPGVEAYKAYVASGSPKMNIEQLAALACEQQGGYSQSLLAGAFRTMVSTLYWAVRMGYEVDFGFGRTQLSVSGNFSEIGINGFDPELHRLEMTLCPSPRLQQCAAYRPVKVEFGNKSPLAPAPMYVSRKLSPKAPRDGSVNKLPAGSCNAFFIYGKRLMLMGDHPDVGVVLRCLSTGESTFYPTEEMHRNSVSCLCFTPVQPFTPGEWEAEITTQYSRSYRPVAEPRTGSLRFVVYEDE